MEEQELASPDGECCLTEETARALTRLATRLDKEMDCALDIEFSISREQEVRVLQARPITTCFTWTDWELEHEFDSAVAADTEIFTRGNVGEVFNGALSPLTMSTVVKSLDLAIAKQAVPKTSEASYISHATTWLAVSKHQVIADLRTRHNKKRNVCQVFLRFLDVLLKFPEPTISVANKGIDFAVFGHQVTTKAMLGE